MNPLTQKAMALLRFIAFGLVLVGGMLLALELALLVRKPALFSLWRCVEYCVPLALGIFVFTKSRAWACAWTDEEEEDD